MLPKTSILLHSSFCYIGYVLRRKMSNETNNTRNKMLCDPHDGSRSSKFLKFCRDFKAAMSGQFSKFIKM